MSIEIRFLNDGDHALLMAAAPEAVFDDDVDERAAREFLADPRHHIVVAIDDGAVVGFVSAVHYVHPDKAGPELWINEVSVASTHRRRGVGKLLMRAMLDRGRETGCSVAWVLTDRSNPAAMGLYESAGGAEDPAQVVMYEFPLGDEEA
jgi:ribosomal protein S18 acetylase RimI-like enzyme